MALSKKDKTDKIYKYGLILVFISLLVFAIFLYFKNKNVIEKQSQTNTDLDFSESVDSQDQVSWDVYTNNEYGFEIAYPRLLREIEVGGGGEYEFFIRFEETQFSQGKGVAVGVSKLSLEEEVKKTTSYFKENFDMEPSFSDNAEVNGHPAVALQYLPGVGYEQRSIIIVNDGNYTYSVSSTPEQMDALVESLIFRNIGEQGSLLRPGSAD